MFFIQNVLLFSYSLISISYDVHPPHPRTSLIKSYIQLIEYSTVPKELQNSSSLVDKEELSSHGTRQTPTD